MAAVDARITQEVDARMQAILQKSNAASMTQWKSACEILLNSNLAYYIDLHVDEVFCHPKHRGGLGLSAFSLATLARRSLKPERT